MRTASQRGEPERARFLFFLTISIHKHTVTLGAGAPGLYNPLRMAGTTILVLFVSSAQARLLPAGWWCYVQGVSPKALRRFRNGCKHPASLLRPFFCAMKGCWIMKKYKDDDNSNPALGVGLAVWLGLLFWIVIIWLVF